MPCDVVLPPRTRESQREGWRGTQVRRGRPVLNASATILNVTTSDSRYALAADIGGTNMRAALLDSQGRITGRGAIDTHSENGIDDAGVRLAQPRPMALK